MIMERRLLSPEYEDWAVIVVDAKDTVSGRSKIAAVSVWNQTYINKTEMGSGLQTKVRYACCLSCTCSDCCPLQSGASENIIFANLLSAFDDAHDACSSSPKDAGPTRIAATTKSKGELEAERLAVFGQERFHLWELCTLPEFRRRGCASALVYWGMNKAAHDNVADTLYVSEQGLLVYRSLRFSYAGNDEDSSGRRE